MSRSAKVRLFFGDRKHDFRLQIEGLEELQELLGCGPHTLVERLTAGQWRIADLKETLRVALIGGGTDPEAALALVDRHVRAGDILRHVQVAQACVMAALIGAPEEDDDLAGERKAGAKTIRSRRSPKAASGSGASTK